MNPAAILLLLYPRLVEPSGVSEHLMSVSTKYLTKFRVNHMKYLRTHIVALFLVIGLTAVFSLRNSVGQGQSKTPTSQSTLAGRSTAQTQSKPQPVLTSEREVGSPASTTVPGSAVAQNSLLRLDLAWVFGGKEQRGWYLYNSLIDRLLDTEAEPASNEFATAVSRWQQKNGLRMTGVLDGDSFKTMFSAWQAARLKDRTYAQPDQLLTAPVSDFYDSSRPDNLRQVERTTYGAYKRMIEAAVSDPSLNLSRGIDGGLAPGEKFLKIVSAFRPREYQDALRRKSPNAGSAGLAVNSPHFTGRALDLYVGGDPVETKDANRAIQVQTPVYRWLVRNAERFGFRPYFYEPWHWEYVGA